MSHFQFWPSSKRLGNRRKFYHSVSFLTSSKRLVKQTYHYSGVFFMNHTATNYNLCTTTSARPGLLINRHKRRVNGLMVKRKVTFLFSLVREFLSPVFLSYRNLNFFTKSGSNRHTEVHLLSQESLSLYTSAN